MIDGIRNLVQREIEESLEELVVENELLTEIDMSPQSLRSRAAAIDARGGMEFELIIPGNRSVNAIANDVARSVGRPVNWSTRYHGARRAPNTYCIEPDASLRPSRPGYAVGWEIITPPLRIQDLFGDLRKIKRWADRTGCYTNSSCGLHMSVSVPLPPGKTLRQKLNYVKLVLLVADDEVLARFGRQMSRYCESALKKLKHRIRQNPSLARSALRELRGDFLKKAGRIVHSGVTTKFESVNVKDNYVEFRSPGGDWLSRNVEELEVTMLRFVVALDAAVDTNKFRRLYRARLEALLQGRDPMRITNRDVNQNAHAEEFNFFVELFADDMPIDDLADMLVQGIQAEDQPPQ